MKIGSGIEKSVWEYRGRSHKHGFIFFKLRKLGYKIVTLLTMGRWQTDTRNLIVSYRFLWKSLPYRTDTISEPCFYKMLHHCSLPLAFPYLNRAECMRLHSKQRNYEWSRSHRILANNKPINRNVLCSRLPLPLPTVAGDPTDQLRHTPVAWVHNLKPRKRGHKNNKKVSGFLKVVLYGSSSGIPI